jgi:hypothetical protein
MIDFVCPPSTEAVPHTAFSLPFESASEVVSPVASFIEVNDLHDQLIVAATMDRFARNVEGWLHLLMVCATRRCKIARGPVLPA